MTFLTEPQRRTVFDKVISLLDTKFSGADVDVSQLRDVHGPRVVGSRNLEDFEQALDALLRDLKTSHTGFFHEARPRSAGRIAMAATLTKANTAADGQRWVFQDVHPGGVAAAAGIASGDILLAVNDQELIPPAATPFRLGESYTLMVRKPDGSTMRPTLAIPGSREKQRPIVVPDQVVSARKLDTDIGYVRVSMFPGVLGIDVARDMSRAISDLACSRLVVDLRGNTGGGIGCHGMSAWMPSRRTLLFTHMGGEGANWVGIAPFTHTQHIFQNLGDYYTQHTKRPMPYFCIAMHQKAIDRLPKGSVEKLVVMFDDLSKWINGNVDAYAARASRINIEPRVIKTAIESGRLKFQMRSSAVTANRQDLLFAAELLTKAGMFPKKLDEGIFPA